MIDEGVYFFTASILLILPDEGSLFKPTNAYGIRLEDRLYLTAQTFNFIPSSTDLNATYVPTPTEAAAGSLTLTLTTTGNGNCQPESDDMIITFTPAPVVNAGADQISPQEVPGAAETAPLPPTLIHSTQSTRRPLRRLLQEASHLPLPLPETAPVTR